MRRWHKTIEAATLETIFGEAFGVEKLSPIVVGPCEPGQILTEAALSIGTQVHAEVAFRPQIAML